MPSSPVVPERDRAPRARQTWSGIPALTHEHRESRAAVCFPSSVHPSNRKVKGRIHIKCLSSGLRVTNDHRMASIPALLCPRCRDDRRSPSHIAKPRRIRGGSNAMRGVAPAGTSVRRAMRHKARLMPANSMSPPALPEPPVQVKSSRVQESDHSCGRCAGHPPIFVFWFGSLRTFAICG